MPDFLDDAKDFVGEKSGNVVDDLGDAGAAGLDFVGAEGVADTVREKSDSAANWLGADVAEMALGDTDDAKKLVHGSPGKLRSTGQHLLNLKDAFDTVGAGMKGVDPSDLRGETAQAFEEKISAEPRKWFEAADACQMAGQALKDFADTVEWAQGEAASAIELHRQGQKASKEARAAHESEVEAYRLAFIAHNFNRDNPLPSEPKPFSDPGTADVEAAVEKLEEARRQRDEAARAAQRMVAAARDAAPPKPSLKEQMDSDAEGMKLGVQHFGGGVLEGGTDLFLWGRKHSVIDPYNLTHPGEYLTNLNSSVHGIATTDPRTIPSTMMQAMRNDPAEFLGTLVPELIGTKGAGLPGSAGRRAAGTIDDVAPSRPHVERKEPGQAETQNKQKSTDNTDPVDLATGMMFLPQTDVALPGALPLVFSRQVDSGYRSGRWFGPSWASTADQRLEIDAKGVILVTEDGLLLEYPHPAPDVPTLPARGPQWPLERHPDGDYTLTDPDTGHVRRYTGLEEPGANGVALLAEISDRNGHTLTFSYDEAGTPTAIAHSAGHVLRLTASEGRITALDLVTDDGRATPVVRYGYTDGELTSVTGSSGLPLRFEYDAEHRVIAWIDSNERRYDYVYDDRNRCIAEGGTEGHLSIRLSYDERDEATGHRVTTLTTAEGHVTRHLVDDAGRVVAVTDPLGHTTRTSHDHRGRVLTRTDALGRTTAVERDAAGRPVTVTRPDGTRTAVEYDALGLPLTVTGPDGTWRHTYDERGNRTSVTDPAGTTTHFGYDDAGHLASVTNALGATTHVTCDAAGLPLTITDPLGGVTRYARDAFGRVTRVTDPLGAVTHLEWNTEGKLLSRTGPDGATERWTYDGEGNCVAHTDPAGGVTTYEYTHFDLLAARTGPDGVRYAFEHDTALRLRQVTDPQGRAWSYTYDPAGHLTSETDFDGRTQAYAYDPAGHLIARTGPLGQVSRFARGPRGEILRKDADGAVTDYTYDTAGRLLSAVSPEAELYLHRDRAGRVKSETVNGRTTAFSYDRLGRRTRRVTPMGAVTTWEYDAAGRRTGMTSGGRSLTFAHDAAGRETHRTIGDGLALTQHWDPANRLTEAVLTGAAPDPVTHRSYAYRPDGALTAVHDLHTGSRRFDLDAAGRVTAVHAAGWTESYAYDDTGNQTHAAWPAEHPAHEATGPRTYTGTRITGAGRVRYEHDDAGRLVLRQKPRLSRKPDTWRYTWDAEDRLTAVTTPDGTRWRYRYDPLGRRTAKQRLAADGETVVEEVLFAWDGPTLIEQTTTAPDLPHPVTLTWDHQGLHPVAQTERLTDATGQREIDSRFFAIVTDLVGTPTELVDETGAVAWRTRSTLWGHTTWNTDATAYTPLRFPGQYSDPETGLHYNVHRYYDPETARYTTPDPLGLSPAPNPTTYVHNPHTWTDPLGLAPDYEDSRERLYRAPHAGNRESEAFGLDPSNHPHTELGGPGTAYLGDSERVAQQYAAQGVYEDGYHEYVMKSEFRESFPPEQYRTSHDNKPGEHQWIIPQSEITRFNEFIEEVHWINFYNGYTWKG
ncbi:putative T7SS-secreted protein [Streptomyces sp. GSL17-111]|uniref:putative T7SS-secreted protein n=1 Tax=Streptomyces sp. GSL17-111 TaxID=3121596 RepID=UPI004040B8FA